MSKVLIVDTYYFGKESFSLERKAFKDSAIELEFSNCRNEDELIEAATDADIILCCGNPPITRKVISSLPKLKAVIRYGIGVNSIDLKAATDFNKIIYFMPGFCSEELVLHASALILNLLRNISFYHSSIREGKWPKRQGPMPRRLSNMVVGLYGFGASARPMANVFKGGYDSRVIACDPFVSESIFKENGVEKVDFDELLSKSDIISIHAPLNKETRHIFNKGTFNKMKNSSMIINIARGPLINEHDLIEALQEGKIKYAGLDVFENEPIDKDNPLLNMDNVVLTPHSAFYGEESLRNQHTLAIKLVRSILIDNEIIKENVANRDVLTDYIN